MERKSANDDITQPLAATHVAVKLPSFFPQRPELWFRQADASFEISKIKCCQTKKNYVLSTLPAEVLLEVEDKLDGTYAELKAAIIERYSASETQRLHTLLAGQELGDRKPSQALRQLRALARNSDVGEAVTRFTFLRMLPENVRAIVACMPQSSTLEQQAQTADRVLETTSTGAAAVNAVSNDPLERIEQRISRLEQGLTTLFNRDDRNDRSFNRYRSSTPRREHETGGSYSTNSDWGKLFLSREVW